MKDSGYILEAHELMKSFGLTPAFGARAWR
jgi:hypothetical protein